MLSTSKTTKTAAGTSGTIDPLEYFYNGTTGQMTRVKYTNDVYAKLNGSNVEVWWGEKGGALSKIIDNSSVNLTTTERFRFEVAPASQFRYDDIVIFSDGVKSTTTFTHNDGNEQTAMTVDGTTTNFAYDAWVRLTSRTRGSLTANYAWRYGSFLANVTSDFPGEASEVDYVYDGLSNRRLKLVDSTDYTWTRYDVSGNPSADFVGGAHAWDIGTRETTFNSGLGETSGSSPYADANYYLVNPENVISGIASNDKSVSTLDYKPNGEVLFESGTPGDSKHSYAFAREDETGSYFINGGYYDPENMIWLPNSDNSISNYGFFPGMPTFPNIHNPRRIINRMWDKSCEVAGNVAGSVARILTPKVRGGFIGSVALNEFSVAYVLERGCWEFCWGLATSLLGIAFFGELYWGEGSRANVSCGITRYGSVHGGIGEGGVTAGGSFGKAASIPVVNAGVNLICIDLNCSDDC